MTLINEIKAKQEEESQRAVFKSTNLEITIKTLSEQNNKMAGEIEQLNLSVSELSGDNANIKCVLDIIKTKRVDQDGPKGQEIIKTCYQQRKNSTHT